MAEGLLPPVVATLVADIREFQAKMSEAKGEMDSLEAKGASTSTLLTKSLGTAALGAAGLALGIGGVSVMLAEKFQSSVAGVSGQLGLSAKQTKAFSDELLNLATGSEFTGGQLAQAYAGVARQVTALAGGTNLAKASTDILKASMELSVATGTDLSNSTQSIVSVMRAFQEPASSASTVMGELYNTSTLTGISTDQLATSLGRMHSRIGVATPSVADLGGLMVELSQHGITGSRAMLGVSTAVEKLLAPSKTSAKTFQDLGLNVYDANGKFIGMRNVIQQLQPAFAGMTQQQQLSTATTLFGAGAAQTMLQVIQAGPAAYDRATKAVDNQRRASEAATKQSKTFHGELQRLNSTAQNIGTTFGLALLPDVQKALDWINTNGLKDLKNFMAGFDGSKAHNWAAGLGRDFKQIVKDVQGFVNNVKSLWNDIPAPLRPLVASTVVGAAVGGKVAGVPGAIVGASAGGAISANRAETSSSSPGWLQTLGLAGWRPIDYLWQHGPAKLYNDISSGSIQPAFNDPAAKAAATNTATNTGTTATNVSQVHSTLLQHSAYLQGTQQYSTYTSEHTRLANAQLDKIHGALTRPNKVNIKVSMK